MSAPPMSGSANNRFRFLKACTILRTAINVQRNKQRPVVFRTFLGFY
jgi:hypothetical protein